MKKLFATIIVASTAAVGFAATPLWMRDVKISPDGKQIAFASDRYGNNDVFIMNADGGSAVRLTTKSGGEAPEAFSPDGKYVYFSANNQKPAASALFPDVLLELYKVPATGGRQEQALPTPAECLSFAKDGSMFVYQDRKGYEDVWRKHHTSSVTRDIWAYDTKTGKHTNLTAHAGEDLCPALSADGSTVYFLSDIDVLTATENRTLIYAARKPGGIDKDFRLQHSPGTLSQRCRQRHDVLHLRRSHLHSAKR